MPWAEPGEPKELPEISRCSEKPISALSLVSALSCWDSVPVKLKTRLGHFAQLLVNAEAGTAAWQGGEQAPDEQPLGFLCFLPHQGTGFKVQHPCCPPSTARVPRSCRGPANECSSAFRSVPAVPWSLWGRL